VVRLDSFTVLTARQKPVDAAAVPLNSKSPLRSGESAWSPSGHLNEGNLPCLSDAFMQLKRLPVQSAAMVRSVSLEQMQTGSEQR
jgi:hypothetical protein